MRSWRRGWSAPRRTQGGSDSMRRLPTARFPASSTLRPVVGGGSRCAFRTEARRSLLALSSMSAWARCSSSRDSQTRLITVRKNKNHRAVASPHLMARAGGSRTIRSRARAVAGVVSSRHLPMPWWPNKRCPWASSPAASARRVYASGCPRARPFRILPPSSAAWRNAPTAPGPAKAQPTTPSSHG